MSEPLDLEQIKARRAKVPMLHFCRDMGHPESDGFNQLWEVENLETGAPLLYIPLQAEGYPDDEALAAFVANAPSDITDLLTEIERLQFREKQLEAARLSWFSTANGAKTAQEFTEDQLTRVNKNLIAEVERLRKLLDKAIEWLCGEITEVPEVVLQRLERE